MSSRGGKVSKGKILLRTCLEVVSGIDVSIPIALL